MKTDLEKIQSEIKIQEQKCDDKLASYSNIELKIKNQGLRIGEINANLADCKKTIKNEQKNIKEYDKLQKDASYNYISWTERVKRQEKNIDTFDIIDDNFFEKLFDVNNDVLAEAHLLNPWVNERYHREREQLFYYALQVNREFILSSSCARSNIKNLLMMWTGMDGEEQVKFKESDKIKAFPSLYQTISILIPVISTTFASVGRFLQYAKRPYEFGTLIIDEAGQAQPQMALGTMLRCRKALVVGDPKQVEPVVTDELDAIKQLIKNEYTAPYVDKRLSVQQFVDQLNNYGTYFHGVSGVKTWVGCPLVIHRRCMNPMFDISNEISYDGIMIQQTQDPNIELENSFALTFSQWIQCSGQENNHNEKDHYVSSQGDKALEIIQHAFEKADGEIPSLFVISPFTSVENGIKKVIKDSNFYQLNKDLYNKWIDSNIGTVHKFQGKEANEVIFLLGCDQDAKSAIQWVNANIVNVAVTRAKYRLCIIGDYQIWKQNKFIKIAKSIIDSYIINELKHLQSLEENDNNKRLIKLLVQRLPSSLDYVKGEDGSGEDNFIDTYSFISSLRKSGFDMSTLSKQELKDYELTEDDLMQLSSTVKTYLITGIKVSTLLDSIMANINIKYMDYSFKNIMFCKATEVYTSESFAPLLKQYFGEKEKNNKKMKDLHLSFGKITSILNEMHKDFAILMDDKKYDIPWWKTFSEQLKEVKDLRNSCCHPEIFTLDKEKQLKKILFHKQVFKNIKVGKQITTIKAQSH